jgi:UDP-N-acetylmuramoyl-L-alanyl-D-glutamate--2,6-diaminopimelate ligase
MLLPKIFPTTSHTKHVGKGSTFVAINGFIKNGSNYIKQAIKRGATTIVLKQNDYQNIQDNIKTIYVENTRQTLAKFSSQALGNPAQKLKIVGITGTKGKTTTTYLIEHILCFNGCLTALIGGIKNKILDQEEASFLTTPESDYLHMFFAECLKKNVEYVVMEVSSHALGLNRVYGIPFEIVGFTNLASEHMDFYKTMEEYFEVKTQLFQMVAPQGSIVINTDNAWGIKALKKVIDNKSNVFPFVQLQQNNKKATPDFFSFFIKKDSLHGISLDIAEGQNPCAELTSPSTLFGECNAYNITMAFIICKKLGLTEQQIQKALLSFPGISGRFQRHTLKNGAEAFIDFAHNSSSMNEALKTLNSTNKKLIVVFGCGGGKDQTKRAPMGNIASLYADTIILTNDNPRKESPNDIIKDILVGIPQQLRHKVTCQTDRKKAIEMAVSLSDKQTTIAILGKGHETHSFIKDEKIYFNDFEEIQKF